MFLGIHLAVLCAFLLLCDRQAKLGLKYIRIKYIDKYMGI